MSSENQAINILCFKSQGEEAVQTIAARNACTFQIRGRALTCGTRIKM